MSRPITIVRRDLERHSLRKSAIDEVAASGLKPAPHQFCLEAEVEGEHRNGQRHEEAEKYVEASRRFTWAKSRSGLDGHHKCPPQTDNRSRSGLAKHASRESPLPPVGPSLRPRATLRKPHLAEKIARECRRKARRPGRPANWRAPRQTTPAGGRLRSASQLNTGKPYFG